ncbi:MAG TPA: Ni/Fe hydrogenase subunit gamma [Gammaproteobacteria bacterium]|nr:Ni/Fe hydrogenase subunit gamma [Gammaproteobacteria bacterium]
MPARIIERIQETDNIFTLRLEFADPWMRRQYRFEPGQFNMLYLYGVGEVPISIVSDRRDSHRLDHTIRDVGRVTHGLAALQAGDELGIRGPFGRGWPVGEAAGRNIVIVTGGLGCAPAVSVIRHVLKRRERYGRLTIMQGVKHSDDLLWRDQYEAWSREPDTQVFLAADVASPGWEWHTGLVTSLFDQAGMTPDQTTVMICGPEPMMHAAAENLIERGFSDGDIWLSMERNMQCAIGHCGHCQIGPHFVCRNGPVFPYPEIRPFLSVRGF